MTPPEKPAAEPRCRHGGYSLRGLTVESNCPECGPPIWKTLSSTAGSGMASACLIRSSKARAMVRSGRASASSTTMAKAGATCGWIGIATAVVLFGTWAWIIATAPV